MNVRSILEKPGTVLVDDHDPGQSMKCSYLLCNPVETIVALSKNEVPAALRHLDECLRNGKFAAGYIAYEACQGLDSQIKSRHTSVFPVIWLGIYDDCVVLDDNDIDIGGPDNAADIRNIQIAISENEYLEKIRTVKQYIADGDVYQINYTTKLRFDNKGSPAGLFSRLRRVHPVPFSSFINTGEYQVISLSPELFLRREGSRVVTKPMKGTMKRGRWFEEDESIARELSQDEKNRAENVMIVDLMRNDLGRISETGSIDVDNLFHVARYASLFQMTSDVTGRLQYGISPSDLLRATFPPGSITGAPKLRAIEIIDELEHEARGPYCGCIGLFHPNGDCLLNVAIRTIVQQEKLCEMGIGSGIVADSDPQAEWAETLLKGHFLYSRRTSFKLLETLRLVDGKYSFAEAHLKRMRNSADYFGWDFPDAELRKQLDKAALRKDGDFRARLLLSEDRTCDVELQELVPASSGPARVLLSDRKTDPSDIFLYHKTTNREAYDSYWKRAKSLGYFDLLYVNTNDEITEGAISNLVVEIDSRWYTPPLMSGLLPGTWRAHKLEKYDITERVLTINDLMKASRIIMGNSVRGDVEISTIEKAGNDSPIWSTQRVINRDLAKGPLIR